MPGEAKSVKRFERSNGLDTALYKNITFFTSGYEGLLLPDVQLRRPHGPDV